MKTKSIPESVDTYIAPREKPLDYPGRRPKRSFLLAKGAVYPLILKKRNTSDVSRDLNIQVMLNSNGKIADLNNYLENLGVPNVRKRYAIIGYGSNPVPGQLISKLGRETVVPVLLGKLRNAEIVYNLISNMGYAFAEVIINQIGIKAPIGVTLLDDNQLQTMMDTEQNYNLAHSPSEVELESGYIIEGGIKSPSYIFAGKRKIWVPENYGHPIPVRELESEGRLHKGLSQEEVLALAIAEFNLTEFSVKSPFDLILRIRQQNSWPERPPKLKYLLQDKIDKDDRSLSSLSSQVRLVESPTELNYSTIL
ncbi:hypothetical protein GWO43_04600 [candidate division KSB1 bacterium]|nr:hypothetical protein [candidate division KSB1 bacterium]NIR71169.1 hypothetical protein [candidate division KSB1 bacterium]NIS23299.1 hypothetical protein [candidate division KSB1 bacterium]NIT70178.1 hypothetical protein [candidate division KSB1 bacterium]NIU23829.1 hypothetical protein [candidate division KSB1 bacterium]